jgi:hypothetical protein
MLLDFRALTYLPTIFLKNAELDAVENLPETDKSDITPIFMLKPWATASDLDRAIERIKKSFGSRPFVLDIDPYYSYADKDQERKAIQEFKELLDPNDDFINWYNYIAKIDFAIPCLRLDRSSLDCLRRQISKATSLDRGFVVYIRKDRVSNARQVIDIVLETEHSNFLIVLDAGWSRDLLDRERWTSDLILQITEQRPEIPVTVSGSSFPDQFSKCGVGESISINERIVFSNLFRRHNAALLIYGDWGSTRPPSSGGGGNPIPPRIDLPSASDWKIYRFPVDQGGYRLAAIEASKSENWNNDLAIWGTYMIDNTKNSILPNIASTQKAAAVRINLHLHIQLRHDQPGLMFDTEDEYID